MKKDKEIIDKANHFFKLGISFYKGSLGGEQDFSKALENFQKAEALNHRYAWEYLAKMHFYGLGTAIDKRQSAFYCKKYAIAGNSEAQSVLGKLYLRGIGVSRNYIEAERWLKKSAKKGNTLDQYLIGLLYFRGLGIKQDLQQAWNWFEKAALLDWFSENGLKDPPCIDGKNWLNERASALCKLCEMSAKGLDREADIKIAAKFYSYAMDCNPHKANACLSRLSASQKYEIIKIYKTTLQERDSEELRRQKLELLKKNLKNRLIWED